MSETSGRAERPWRPRGDAMAAGFGEDTYGTREHLREPSTCTDCGAYYHDGRWTWTVPGAGEAEQVVCPACRRIRDDYPAGILTIAGTFFGDHEEEIRGLISNTEEAEKSEHPLHRVMDAELDEGELIVRTTDIHLPRRIGEALKSAYDGELDFHYDEGSQFLRARWER